MSPLVFLALALVISAVGTVALWLRHRRPDTPDATIDEFRSKMRALSDDLPGQADGANWSGRSDTTRHGG
ncbi:MAG: hypothetical protein M5U19_08485 [Microthrixaceae bacterium]|nr:hypothetical protein [Microthrixaceae bacterium]